MRVALAAAVALFLISASVADQVHASIRKHTHIAAQDLGTALKAFAQERGLAMIYRAEVVSQLNTSGAIGELTTDEALHALLNGTQLTYKFLDEKTVTIVPAATAPPLKGKDREQEAHNRPSFREVFRLAEAVPEPVENSTESAEVIVRATTAATKTDTNILLVPQSVQQISLDVMQDQKAQGLADVVKNVSGVQPWFAYGGTRDIFVIRSFLTSAANFRNGVRIPAARFDLANVDHVEVLKGPSSVLYGSADPGGLVNTVTKIPTLKPSFAVEQLAGSYDRSRTEASASGPLNGERTFLGRIDGSYLTGRTFRDLSENDRVFVSPSLTWEVGSRTRINLSYEYMDDRVVYDSGVPAVGDRVADIPRSRAFGTSGVQDKNRTDLVDFNLTHELNDALSLTAGILTADTKVDWNLFYAYGLLEEGDELLDTYASYGEETVDTDVGWLNLLARFQTGRVSHKALMGVEYNKLKLQTGFIDLYVNTNNIFQPGPYNVDADYELYATAPRGFEFNQNLESKAVFIQDEMTLSDNLHLVVGARYDDIDTRLSTTYYQPTFEYSSRTDTKLSPRVGIVYQTENQLSLYASYIKSFGPSFNYDSFNRFPPATAKQYEIGAKKEFLGGRVLSTIAFYDLIKGNVPTPDPNDPLITLLIGEAESRGVEIDVQGKVNAALSILATYAYADAEITRDNSGNRGNWLPYAPRHQASLSAKYDWQSGASQGFSLGGGFYGASKRYGDLTNSFSDGSYVRLDLFAAYRMKLAKSMMTAQLNVNNVTDAEYYNLRSRWSNMPAEPRAVFGSIRFQF